MDIRSVVYQLLLLLVPSYVWAATAVTMYVNTDCANDGDGTAVTCAASDGAAGAKKTLNDWNNDEAKDLVTADEQHTVIVSGDTIDTGNVNGVNISGWTVDATRYLVIKCDSGTAESCPSGGKWDDSAYIIQGRYGIIISDDYVRVEGIQVDQNSTLNGRSGILVSVAVAASDIRVTGNIVKCTGTDNASAAIKVDTLSATAGSYDIVNNTVYDCTDGIYVQQGSGTTSNIYHNTAYNNSDDGFYMRGENSGDTMNIRNNIADTNGTDYVKFGTMPATVNESNNLASDTTASGTGSLDSKNPTYVNEGADDFHIDSGDTTGLLNGGFDLTGIVDTDIDGDSRDSSPDMGSDEQAGGGGGGFPFRANTVNLTPLEEIR